MAENIRETARKLAARFAVLRARDFERNRVPRRYLTELVETGLRERSGKHGVRNPCVWRSLRSLWGVYSE